MNSRWLQSLILVVLMGFSLSASADLRQLHSDIDKRIKRLEAIDLLFKNDYYRAVSKVGRSFVDNIKAHYTMDSIDLEIQSRINLLNFYDEFVGRLIRQDNLDLIHYSVLRWQILAVESAAYATILAHDSFLEDQEAFNRAFQESIEKDLAELIMQTDEFLVDQDRLVETYQMTLKNQRRKLLLPPEFTPSNEVVDQHKKKGLNVSFSPRTMVDLDPYKNKIRRRLFLNMSSTKEENSKGSLLEGESEVFNKNLLSTLDKEIKSVALLRVDLIMQRAKIMGTEKESEGVVTELDHHIQLITQELEQLKRERDQARIDSGTHFNGLMDGSPRKKLIPNRKKVVPVVAPAVVE